MTKDIRDIAGRLNKFVHAKKFSLIELSELTGLSRETLSRIGRGTQIPGGETLAKLHEETDLDILWLLTGKPIGEWDLIRYGGQPPVERKKIGRKPDPEVAERNLKYKQAVEERKQDRERNQKIKEKEEKKRRTGPGYKNGVRIKVGQKGYVQRPRRTSEQVIADGDPSRSELA